MFAGCSCKLSVCFPFSFIAWKADKSVKTRKRWKFAKLHASHAPPYTLRTHGSPPQTPYPGSHAPLPGCSIRFAASPALHLSLPAHASTFPLFAGQSRHCPLPGGLELRQLAHGMSICIYSCLDRAHAHFEDPPLPLPLPSSFALDSPLLDLTCGRGRLVFNLVPSPVLIDWGYSFCLLSFAVWFYSGSLQ